MWITGPGSRRCPVRDDETGDTLVGAGGDNASCDELIFCAVGAALDDSSGVGGTEPWQRVQLLRAGGVDVEGSGRGMPALGKLLLEGHLGAGGMERAYKEREDGRAKEAHR